MIHIDEPGVVVDAIRRVHSAVRNKTRLAHDGSGMVSTQRASAEPS
jgi:hypothetical protein